MFSFFTYLIIFSQRKIAEDYHAEKLSDLKKGAFDELQEHMVWAEKEFKIKIDSLKSVVSIGIKVGKQTFTQ